MRLVFIANGLALCVATISLAETPKNPSKTGNLERLLACKSLPQSDARLACFDTEITKLEAEISEKKLTVVSRDDLKSAQKSVFGLSLPNLRLFGANEGQNETGASEEEGVGYIEVKLADARQGPDGKWTLTLADGARWAQTDTATIRMPKAGDIVRIRKAALGSYMANINGRPAIRVRRVS